MTRPPPGVRVVADPTPAATRLTLVRHGESVCNAEGRVGGPIGCTGLTDLGRAQAEALQERLLLTVELVGASALWTSVLPRAIETAQIVAPGVGDGRVLVAQDCDLCELHPGDADGLAWTEFAAQFGEPDWDADPTTVVAPGGESWSGFVRRAADALDRVRAATGAGGWAVVVCHGGVIEASMVAFLPVARRLKLRTRYTSITEWEHDLGSWRLLRYNDAAHLDAGGIAEQTPRPDDVDVAQQV